MSKTPASNLESQTRYDPGAIEKHWFTAWEVAGLFTPDPAGGAPAYTIAVPPPNVTGSLHMGHALNGTIQDVLLRSARMQGKNTLWICGTDHAGIATQTVVEKELRKTTGKSRHDLGRREFTDRVWEWKNRYGSTIIEQFKRLGASLDYANERFTLDEGYVKAVYRVFVELYNKGIIYRDTYMVNWCPHCLTALSDLEVEHEQMQDRLYTLRYPLADGQEGITVATVRPETMLGDTGIAVSPKDSRYAHLIGKEALLPLVGRRLPIFADDHVDPQFGSGAVKVTPAHDPADFEMGRAHGLEEVNILTPQGVLNEAAGEYAGLSQAQARIKILSRLEAEGALVGSEPYTHQVGTCYRCHTRIEPTISLQWFARMQELAGPAAAAVREGRVRFSPQRWSKVYLDWMDKIRPWCISRQLWWGHRLPVWYCDPCNRTIVAEQAPAACSECGGALRQDEDVLDTWFSSALWPFATLGWPDQTARLEKFYPTDLLVTARDIIFLWVARMVMLGLRFTGNTPFHTVVITPTILASDGRRMSKSLGTGVDPLELIEAYGADATRFGLLAMSSTQDVRFSNERIVTGRNFANKVWNAARFVLTASPAVDSIPEGLQPTLADRWIISRLHDAVNGVDKALEKNDFSELTRILYEFFWHDFCDRYLEAVKERLKGEDSGDKTFVAAQLHRILETSLALLHPVMPFLTEEIFTHLAPSTGLLVDHPFPVAAEFAKDPQAEEEFGKVMTLVVALRTWRSEQKVQTKRLSGLILSVREAEEALYRRQAGIIETLTRSHIDSFSFTPNGDMGETHAVLTVPGGRIFIPLEGLVNRQDEQVRLKKTLEIKQGDLAALQVKLANPDFVGKAPAAVVQKTRERAATLENEISGLQTELA